MHGTAWPPARGRFTRGTSQKPHDQAVTDANSQIALLASFGKTQKGNGGKCIIMVRSMT